MSGYKKYSILFLDIRKFTLFFDQVYTSDPEQVARLLGDLWRLLEPIITGYSGKVHKTLGDGVMVLFKNSNEAFEAALKLMFEIAKIDEHLNLPTPADPQGWLGMPFQAGIGIEEGMVGVETVKIQGREHELIIGMPVIIAARLADRAEPMKILIGEEAYRTISKNKKWDPSLFKRSHYKAKHKKEIVYWEFDTTPLVYNDGRVLNKPKSLD